MNIFSQNCQVHFKAIKKQLIAQIGLLEICLQTALKKQKGP